MREKKRSAGILLFLSEPITIWSQPCCNQVVVITKPNLTIVNAAKMDPKHPTLQCHLIPRPPPLPRCPAPLRSPVANRRERELELELGRWARAVCRRSLQHTPSRAREQGGNNVRWGQKARRPHPQTPSPGAGPPCHPDRPNHPPAIPTTPLPAPILPVILNQQQHRHWGEVGQASPLPHPNAQHSFFWHPSMFSNDIKYINIM